MFLVLRSVSTSSVALLAEGVDRNLHIPTVTPKTSVALLAEGVDRNLWFKWGSTTVTTSPSSRRAWIEIDFRMSWSMEAKVALLAEGVDRNNVLHQNSILFAGRPPRGGRG